MAGVIRALSQAGRDLEFEGRSVVAGIDQLDESVDGRGVVLRADDLRQLGEKGGRIGGSSEAFIARELVEYFVGAVAGRTESRRTHPRDRDIAPHNLSQQRAPRWIGHLTQRKRELIANGDVGIV